MTMKLVNYAPKTYFTSQENDYYSASIGLFYSRLFLFAVCARRPALHN